MPPLRQRLTRPHPWLCALVVLMSLAGLDAARQPGQQVSARIYVAAVHAYQRVGRPLLAGHIACRYAPTCSDYSIGAVRRHGLLTGLRLSARRIRSCTRTVPRGTVDRVP